MENENTLKAPSRAHAIEHISWNLSEFMSGRYAKRLRFVCCPIKWPSVYRHLNNFLISSPFKEPNECEKWDFEEHFDEWVRREPGNAWRVGVSFNQAPRGKKHKKCLNSLCKNV